MRIIQLTPGTGNFYCGSCLRDSALVRALRARGHDVLMVPLYLPLVTDADASDANAPIFLSGISVFLEQKYPSLRLPEWLQRILRSPRLLQLAARRASMTSARSLGEATVSMLQNDNGRQTGELARLVAWLRTQPPPDLICLSNSLLSGMARRLKEELRVPVVCTLQGEDSFLDGLPEPFRRKAWDLLRQRCADVDHFIAVSQYFGAVMHTRLDLDVARLTVVHPGIATEDFAVGVTPPTPTIGYLARMHPSKGLGILVDAFIHLKQWNKVAGLRLRIAGAKTNADEHYVKTLQRKFAAEQLLNAVDFLPNLEHRAKADFLRRLTVFSVPATYGEAFGLYLLEALASGVPVVQPRHGAFPEVVQLTGGGVLYEPNDAAALATALQSLLLDPATARRLGENGRRVVQEQFSVAAMARKTEEVFARVIQRSR
ncbi:MAG: glycosyltransferase family 1 protein [Verrucomicrobia bacterium]|nr:MAG: glycosyltransferase family 1 protein [Verrucomicrobiota bacterium]